MTMGHKGNTYSKEFKEQAVAMLNSGRSGKQIEAELGLSTGIVYRWRDQMRAKKANKLFPATVTLVREK